MEKPRSARGRKSAVPSSDTISVPQVAGEQPKGESGSHSPLAGYNAARKAKERHHAEARRRLDELLSEPLKALWQDWARGWRDLVDGLLDGDNDNYRAAASALAEVGRLLNRVDEFRSRDLSDLLVADVPNLLANCPPFPLPAQVLPRLRAMASSNQFHTIAPVLAAKLLVAAAEGTPDTELARELSDAATGTQSREAFGWFGFIRDRVLPLPGPDNVDLPRTEATPGVQSPDLHDVGLAEGLLPGRIGGHLEIPDVGEVEESASNEDDRAVAVEPAKELPLQPWTVGTFAANLRLVIGRLRVWHDDPFRFTLTILPVNDTRVSTSIRETFQESIVLYVGRSEPVPNPLEIGDQGSDTERANTLWHVGEVSRHLDVAPQGSSWDFLRHVFAELLRTPVWETSKPPTNTAPMEFLARQGHLVVVGRPVPETLLRGLELASERLLDATEPDFAVSQTNKKPAAPKGKRGRPRLSPEEQERNKKLYLDYKKSGLTKDEFLQFRRLPQSALSLMERGRKAVEKEQARAGKKPCD